jgi:hypothetical protein
MPRRKPKKRKPRVRKRIVSVVQPNTIPYKKVRVEWCDILSDSGWTDSKGFDKMRLAYPVNEGWVFDKTNKHIKLFASYDKEDDGTFTFGDRTMIPMACVKKIVKLS